ncbi:MAG: WD40 repeat domain-containing protein [Gemmataceae bacterium]
MKLSFDAWADGHVAPAEYELPVVLPNAIIKLEPVSSRLRATLQHPSRRGVLSGVRYSPDGSKLVASSYPEGVVQFWDAVSGRQLGKVETPPGYRGSADYAMLAPDWGTVYATVEGRRLERFERDGKPMIRWKMDGFARAWDAATGEVRRTYRAEPPANPLHATLSPNGRWLMTIDELSGEREGGPQRAASLWDVASGQRRSLPETVSPYGVYSADSKSFAASTTAGEFNYAGLAIVDTGAAKVVREIATGVAFGNADPVAFSPDGRRLIGSLRSFPGKGDYSSWQTRLATWDVTTGRELGSFPSPGPKTWMLVRLSTDGRTVAAILSRPPGAPDQEEPSKLFLLDGETLALRKAVVLGANFLMSDAAFRPDGKLVTLLTRPRIADNNRRDPSAEDYPQPKILLIDAATGDLRATLVLPQCFSRALAFSPDGKTLAVGGPGQVLLFDVGDL